jgi:hypothetical protein
MLWRPNGRLDLVLFFFLLRSCVYVNEGRYSSLSIEYIDINNRKLIEISLSDSFLDELPLMTVRTGRSLGCCVTILWLLLILSRRLVDNYVNFKNNHPTIYRKVNAGTDYQGIYFNF